MEENQKMERYAAIIIDIKNSRKMIIQDRIDAQQKLIDIVEFINYIYQDVLIKELDFSAGDSIQGLFKNLRNAFNAYLFIRNLFYPFELRCGIGFASIDNFKSITRRKLTTNMIDGEAYHLAHQALIVSKETDNNFLLYSTYFKSDILINQMMSTVDLLLKSQTANQANIGNIMNLLYPINYHNLIINISSYSRFLINIMKENSNNHFNFSSELYCQLMETIDYASRKNQREDQNMDFNRRVFYESIFPTKLDVLISEFFNTSRQNISKIKQSGHIEEIRKLELSAMSYLENIYDRENK